MSDRPDTGQLAFEQFRNDIRKARAAASRDLGHGEACSGNAQRSAPKAAEYPAEIRREPGTKEPSTRTEAPEPDPEEREAMAKADAEEPGDELHPGDPGEPDPLEEAERAEDHADRDGVPWP